MTDGHFVGLEGNADSLQLPTVDVLVRQQNKKKKLVCRTKENTMDRAVVGYKAAAFKTQK